MPAAIKAAKRTDIKIGDTVWFADRRNGRFVENVAKVVLVADNGSLTISYKTNFENEMLTGVREWIGSDKQTHGWWKVKN